MASPITWEQLRELAFCSCAGVKRLRGAAARRPAGGDVAGRVRRTVEVIGEEHRDLEPVGGVAALRRF